jgi:glycosyltransferase involved in cell wall biosynthesis
MNIVFIVTRGDSIGGAQIHVKDLAFRLAAEGDTVTVVTGSEGDMTRLLSERNIPFRIANNLVRPMHPVKDLLAILEIRGMLKELKPDLVSTHTAKAGLVGRIAARLAGVPSIFTVHGWQFAEGIPSFQRFVVESLERFSSRLCARIITVSKYDEDFARRRGVVPPEKMITIHNGMPDIPPRLLSAACRAEVPPAARADGGPENAAEKIETARRPAESAGDAEKTADRSAGPASPVRLVMTARFQPQKDHPTLFRALAALKDQPWTLDLIGDGPDTEACRALAEELGIAGRIDFAGQRLDVAERLAEADVFLLVTKWEGFPRSILEAMRAGLPVIASDVGGCKESVEEGVTGYLVPKEDPEALAERLRELTDSPDLRTRMGRAGRKSYEENFTFEAMYRKTRGVYREIVPGEAIPRPS